MNRKVKIKKFFKLASENTDIGFDLREGDTDASTDGEVSLLQELLELYGFKLKQYGVDGYFGPETKAALLLFQKVNGLQESGVADEATRRLIFKGDPKENVDIERSEWLRDTLQSIERDDAERSYSASG